MKDTVLILGGAIWSENLFKALQQIGLRIMLTDINPDSPMRKYADEFYNVSAEDSNEILNIISGNERIIIAYCGGDFATRSALSINQELLKKKIVNENPDIFIDKVKMKEFFKKANIKTPEGEVISRNSKILEKIHYPRIFKPIGLSGARGVEVINSYEDSIRYFEKYKYDSVLNEEIAYGTQHDVNGFFVDGNFYPAGLSDRFFSLEPIYPLYGYSPSVLEVQTQNKIYESLKEVGIAAGIDTGPIKGDVFVSNERNVVYNEIGFRFHGDITSCIVLPNTGRHFPFLEYLSKLAPQYDKMIQQYYKSIYRKKQTIRWDIIRFSPGIFKGIQGMDKIASRSDLLEIILRKKKGDLLKGPYDNSDMLGYFLTANSSHVACEQSANEIHNNLKVEVDV